MCPHKGISMVLRLIYFRMQSGGLDYVFLTLVKHGLMDSMTGMTSVWGERILYHIMTLHF